MDWLVEWDRAAFLTLNQSLRSEFMDRVMPWATNFGLYQVQVALGLTVAILAGYFPGELRPADPSGLRRVFYRQRAWLGPFLLAVTMSGLLAQAGKVIPGQRPWWFYEHQHARGLDVGIEVKTVRGVYPLKVRRFPSGHTATSAAAATVITWLAVRRRRGLLLSLACWLLAVVVAFSRIYLGSHWPLDILGGAAVGVASGIAAVYICRAAASRNRPPEAL